jgi:uncharacterized integral membrane protein
MLRFLRYLFLIVTGGVLLVLALANRAPVTVRWLPEDMATLMGRTAAVELPIFVVILGAVAAGVLIGFVWEWFREARIRAEAKGKTREVARLERELAVLKDSTSVPPQDEVLALLEKR